MRASGFADVRWENSGVHLGSLGVPRDGTSPAGSARENETAVCGSAGTSRGCGREGGRVGEEGSEGGREGGSE